MSTLWLRFTSLVGVLLLIVLAVPAFAHGDKVIPQVPDGTGSDGTSFRTKFDFTNLGPDPSTAITNVQVLFFRQNGTPWSVATNLGTNSSFTLNLGAFQTLRLETLGTSSQLTAGYVIVRNLEPTTIFAEDYEVAITAYYEVAKAGKVIDTVSVPVGQPTVAWVFPVQIDNANNLLTGLAIVNLDSGANNVTLKLYRAGSPSSGSATDAGTGSLTLNGNEQKALFLYPSIFSSLSSFKGMVLAISDKPVAILALLQTPTPTGVQYATMVPAYADALRRNTFMYLRQGFPLDADIPVSDYFGNSDDQAPWDLLYVTDSTDNTKRRLEARQGAKFAVLGTKNDVEFDDLTFGDLRNLDLRDQAFTATMIDLSNSSPNLAPEFAFAIKTGLGRYVKVRIADVITRSDSNNQPIYRDLALEMYVYK